MVNKAYCSSEELVFRLGLLKNAFIIYETSPKPWHDLTKSSYLEQPPHNLFCPKKLLSSHEKLFGKNPPIL